ncbi:MAG: DUF6057 family protein [Planctomycetia bacterium]|nr:DUF6057 family protein [Planctomycetia bacterium]
MPQLFRSHNSALTLFSAFFLLFCVWFWRVRFGAFLTVVNLFALPLDASGDPLWRLHDPYAPMEALSLTVAQTFAFPWLGALIMTLLTSAITALAFLSLRRTIAILKSKGRADEGAVALLTACAFLPGILSAALFLNVGLNVFESLFGLFYLAPTIGSILTLAIAALLRQIPHDRTRRALVLILPLALFPALGVFVIILVLSGLFHEFERALANASQSVETKKTPLPWRYALGAILVALVEPALYRALLWREYPLERVYRAGLFPNSIVPLDNAIKTRLTLLYLALLVVLTLILAAPIMARIARVRLGEPSKTKETRRALTRAEKRAARKFAKRAKGQRGKSHEDDQNTLNEPVENQESPGTHDVLLRPSLAAALVLATLWLCPCSEELRATCLSARYVLQENWEDALRVQARLKFTTRTQPHMEYPSEALYLVRLTALYRTDRLAEELFAVPTPSAESQRARVDAYRVLAAQALYAWRFDNLAERAAMNNFVATCGRSWPANLTLAQVALARGDRALAERYLRRLEGHSPGWRREIVAQLRKSLDAPTQAYARPIALARADHDVFATGIESPRRSLAQALLLRNDLAERANRGETLSPQELALWQARVAFALLDLNFELFRAEAPACVVLLSAPPRSFQETALFLDRLAPFDVSPFKIPQQTRDKFQTMTQVLEYYKLTHSKKVLRNFEMFFSDTAWRYFLFNDVDAPTQGDTK